MAMGSHIEINDTLKLTRERGMPAEPKIDSPKGKSFYA